MFPMPTALRRHAVDPISEAWRRLDAPAKLSPRRARLLPHPVAVSIPNFARTSRTHSSCRCGRPEPRKERADGADENSFCARPRCCTPRINRRQPSPAAPSGVLPEGWVVRDRHESKGRRSWGLGSLRPLSFKSYHSFRAPPPRLPYRRTARDGRPPLRRVERLGSVQRKDGVGLAGGCHLRMRPQSGS